MSNISDLGAGNYLPTFNDPKIYTCYIDGQTFDDPGVYQQHLLMYHGLNISVDQIAAPVAPLISQPLGIIAPGVTLTPAGDQPYTYTPTYTPPLQPVTVPYTPAPIRPGVSYDPATGQAGQATAKGSGWNELLGIGAILALGIGLARSRRKARARR